MGRSIRNLKQLCTALSQKPLASKPSTRYDYSFAYDILGRVCEVISGLPLERFMERHFLKPMGMHSTYFVVPERKRLRAAKLYEAKAVPPRSRAKKGGKTYKLSLYRQRGSAAGIR